MKTREQHNVTC